MSDQTALKDALNAINFSIDHADGESAIFLKMWREGDWQGLAKEFPEYDIPEYLVKAFEPVTNSVNLVRPMEFHDTKVFFHAHEGRPHKVIDHADNIELIEIIINELSEKNQPRLIVIEGQTGTGKTVLCHSLLNNAVGAILVDGYSVNRPHLTLDVLSVSPLLNQPDATYLIDEIAFFDPEGLDQALRQHVLVNQGIAVLFTQSINDCDLTVPYVHLTLTRDGLSQGQCSTK